jgi:hypothetical protein
MAGSVQGLRRGTLSTCCTQLNSQSCTEIQVEAVEGGREAMEEGQLRLGENSLTEHHQHQSRCFTPPSSLPVGTSYYPGVRARARAWRHEAERVMSIWAVWNTTHVLSLMFCFTLCFAGRV